MKIAAFDIAIKTLSVCIMEEPSYNDSNELIYKKPIFWDIFNVLDQYPICCEPGCELDAKWKNEAYRNYCGRHKKRGRIFKDLTEIDIRTKAKEYTPFEIQTRLVQTLDKYPEVYNVDYMFIENQDQDNTHMCNIASSLFTYYTKKAYVDIEKPRLKEIKYIRATRKTKNVPIVGEEFISTKSNSYTRRKETSIVYCRRNCEKYMPELLNFFNSHKKKDDLADSYQTALAGIWVLHFKQVYPKITPSIVEKYSEIHRISNINEKGRKKTFKQYVKEFQDKYVWIMI